MINKGIKLDEVAAMYAPLKSYIDKIIPLMLKHTWILKNKFDNDTEYQLRQSLWICRLITLDSRILDIEKQDEIKGWESLRGEIIEQINNCTSYGNLERMADNIMNLTNPILSKNYIEMYSIPKREFNSWWYTIHKKETLMAVHLINGYQPESPFSNQKEFAENLLKAIKKAKSLHDKVVSVECGSWLNQYPKFQKMWPNSFIINQKVLNKTGGFGPGAWGQYMRADGSFLENNAQFLLKNNEHPYYLTQAVCSYDELKEHLENYLYRLN